VQRVKKKLNNAGYSSETEKKQETFLLAVRDSVSNLNLEVHDTV
jgi:hypothetical protein